MATREWWARPRLWAAGAQDEGEETERRVSWLELFSDLVFVVVIAELAHYLEGHVSRNGVLGYILLFVAAWWAWIGGTFYNERFETYDISYRLFTFGQMLGVAALAIFAYNGLGSTSQQFALAYAAVRALITLMWFRGGWHEPRFRPVSNRYTIGFSFSIALFVASVFVPIPWRFALWGLGLFIDLFTPVTTLRYQATLPRVTHSKLPERFGLFVLIVLGEAIVGVVRGVAAGAGVTPSEGVILLLGLAVVFGLWWVYFDFVGRRTPRPGVWWLLAWAYGHLPLVMAIAAIGAAVQRLVAPREGESSAGAVWLLCGAVAVAFLTIAWLEGTLRPGDDEPTEVRASLGLKVAAGVGAILLGALGRDLPPLAIFCILLGLTLAQMLYGAYVWYTQPIALSPHH